MSTEPANVEETTRQIIEAGIAERMLVRSEQHDLPNDPSGCKFWVELWEYQGKEYKGVHVVTPDGRRRRFGADLGVGFGIAGQPPLSKPQQDVVDQLALEWKQSNPVSPVI